MSFQWLTPPDAAWGALAEQYRQSIEQAIRAIADRRAPEIEAWLKQNAPWTDRTGQARQTLHTEVREVAHEMIEIILAHGVDYGIYLELRWAGRFAVINPALDIWTPLIWQDVQGIFR